MEQTFLADTHEDLRRLRPELREELRQVEGAFQEAMRDVIAALPDHLAEGLQLWVTETPRRFMEPLIPFFVSLSRMRDYEEIAQKQERARRGGSIN